MNYLCLQQASLCLLLMDGVVKTASASHFRNVVLFGSRVMIEIQSKLSSIRIGAYICEACMVKGLRSSIPLVQAWIHTSFHRFMEIGQIFHNRHIKEKLSKLQGFIPARRRNWPIFCLNDSEIQERGLRDC